MLRWPPCSRPRLLLSFGSSGQSMCYCGFATLTCAVVGYNIQKAGVKARVKNHSLHFHALFFDRPSGSFQTKRVWMDTSVGLQIPTACRWQWIKCATANVDWLIRPKVPIMQKPLVCSTCSSGLVTSPTHYRPSVVIMENT